MSETLDFLDRHWRSTCKVIFGREVGALEQYEKWLLEYADPLTAKKSSIGGKDVQFYVSDYAKGAKYAAFDEVWEKQGFAPLNLNEIKDMDSLISAVQERACYTGSVILGNSKFVEKSSNITDSFYVYKSGYVVDCEGVAYSSIAKLSKDIFGSNALAESRHLIKCSTVGHKISRCFEVWVGESSSDCHYSHNLSFCNDCIFCFNLVSKRNAIGNLELPKGKYLQLKAKLVAAMADELERKKQLPSLIEIAAGAKGHADKSVLARVPDFEEEGWDPKPLDAAFGRTSEIVLGRRLSGMAPYVPWLKERVKETFGRKSCVSGKPIIIFDFYNLTKLPIGRLVKEKEAKELGRLCKASEGEIEGISLASAGNILGKIAYFCPETRVGKNENVAESLTYHSSNAIQVATVVYSKYCAYSNWARTSEHIFGSCIAHESSFCIRCHHSKKITRCFEVESSRDCSDCYFCHNCENVHDSMFCFNIKNKSYAIGNVEVGKEEYARVKKMLLDEIGARLEKDKRLQWDIYNIGANK
ncbi:MAG: hypothetical protein WC717_02895 [Candidatus Micrarchaeia archaeon]|jgi:hypothetical protein